MSLANETASPRRDFVFEDRERGIFKVHRSSMTLPSVLDEERTKVFDRCWLYLGHESEVVQPGDFKTRWVGGRSLLYLRDADGRLHAFLNSCRHQGAEVCREDGGNAKRFTCFYHGFTYANDGRLVSMPGEDSYGPNFDKSRFSLYEARLESYRGFVFVTFDPDIVDLVTYLAGAREYLDLIADQSPAGLEVIAGTHKYSMRANWKLLPANSLDGYHAFTVHSTWVQYLKDTGADLSGGIRGVGKGLGNGHSVIDYFGVNGRPVALWEPAWGEAAREDIAALRKDLVDRFGEERAAWIAERNKNLLVFPNLVINDIMSLVVRTCWPVSHDYMDVTTWALGIVGEPAHQRERRLDSFLTFLGPGGFATPDDVEVLDVCQRGFSTFRELEWSDLSRGMHKEVCDPDEEEQMRAFWRHWNKLMSAEIPPLRLGNGSLGAPATAGNIGASP